MRGKDGTCPNSWSSRRMRGRILKNVARFSKLPDILKLAGRNALCNLGRKYVLDLCVITVQSSIQPLESGPVASSHSQFESHGGASIPDFRQTGVCRAVLDNSPVSLCRRTVMQSDPLVEMFSCLPVRDCMTNGHVSGVSAKEATPTTQVQSAEMCAYDDSDWSRRNPNRALGMEVSRTGTTCAEYCAYIRATSLNDWAVSNRPAVEPIVFGYPHRLVRGARNEDTTWFRLTCFSFYNCQVWWIAMSSSKNPPEAGRPSAVEMTSTHLPGTFLGHVLNFYFDRLYDLTEDIPDVMGLQALRPSAAVCKVMTVLNSRCVRIVTPDEHVKTGFHKILVHDMAREHWPLVTLSDIGCLRIEGPFPRNVIYYILHG